MFHLYSKGCEYVLRALVEASLAGGKGPFLARDVCRRAGVPEAFTRKMLQRLKEKGILRAAPGPGGGYGFRRPLEKLSVLEIVEAVDGAGAYDGCVLGLKRCSDKSPCALHETWLKAKKSLLPGLGSKTLEDLVRTVRR